MKYFVLSAGVLVCLAAVAGCGGDTGQMAAEKMAEKAIESSAAESGESVDAKVNVSDESASITVKGEDGTVEINTGDAAKLPGDFPKDVPVYPGMKFELTSKNQEDATFMITGTSPDSMDKIAAFYKDKAAAGGWNEEQSVAMAGQMQMLNYAKDDRTLIVNIVPQDGGGSTISISTGNQ